MSVSCGAGKFGVGQPANFTACSRLAVCFLPSAVLPVASIFSIDIDRPPLDEIGVGHPVETLSDVRCPRACSAQICRRSGVACAFQVSANMVKPGESSSAGNLLAKNACRTALADEVEERRP
jgi:hypothetical protein